MRSAGMTTSGPVGGSSSDRDRSTWSDCQRTAGQYPAKSGSAAVSTRARPKICAPRLLAWPASGAKTPTETRGSAAMLRSFGEPAAAVNSSVKSRWK
ncbi:hypothetical protein Aau02nite_31890 [Amorphoplanes auranticolor]|uniref:Uncharacterized protein n=1 Tax=Actinoplanes auranticolor TaxID=47988 RepID=A0A919SBB9_9ACTN|nr:hypothetical protein Aau02nite_31890 [Actinoplanes auranticolor]